MPGAHVVNMMSPQTTTATRQADDTRTCAVTGTPTVSTGTSAASTGTTISTSSITTSSTASISCTASARAGKGGEVGTNRRVMGNITFIGELFKQDLVPTSTVMYCTTHLLLMADDASFESLCSLLDTAGARLEAKVGGEHPTITTATTTASDASAARGQHNKDTKKRRQSSHVSHASQALQP